MENYLGYFAAVCTTVAYIPQVVKVYKTKSTNDISLGMFSLMTLGIFCWMIYGFLIDALPVILANLITLFLSSYIFIMKLKNSIKAETILLKKNVN